MRHPTDTQTIPAEPEESPISDTLFVLGEIEDTQAGLGPAPDGGNGWQFWAAL